jgi:nucleoside-diphosphate-sugar epimerase
MSLLQHALRAGQSGHIQMPITRRRAIVIGGAGALGAAVLEHLLAGAAFAQVSVVVSQPLNAALRGLATVAEAGLGERPEAGAEDTAIVVFDRERHANGRELAFSRPRPETLASLATTLRERGVRRLLVVMPHAAASLPEALKRGLANLDEHAVAALGFEHLVFVRSAQMPGDAASSPHPLQRLADWVLAQMRLMIPQRDKPVRPAKVAQFVAGLAARLHASPPGTRVVPPELVWEAAQRHDVDALVQEWLRGVEAEASTPQPMRM